MKTIVQKIIFKNTNVKDLYDLYTNAKKHSEVTRAKAKISEEEDSTFSVYDGYIRGKNLQLIRHKLIVQSWRGSDWEKDDIDSTFIISLEPKGKHAILHAVHANIPEKHVVDIAKGWHEFYWEPWKKHLNQKRPTN